MEIWKSKWGLETRRNGFVHYMAIYQNRVTFLGWQLNADNLDHSPKEITVFLRNISGIKKIDKHAEDIWHFLLMPITKNYNRSIRIDTFDKKSYRASFLGENLFEDWNKAYEILSSLL